MNLVKDLGGRKIIRKSFLLIFCLTVVLGATVFSQDEAIRVETNLVTVNVLVKDRSGNPLKGISRDQFEVFDRGELQNIALFSAAESPIAYGVVYDMHPTDERQSRAVLDSLRNFARNLDPKDTFFLVAFDERGSLQTDFVPTEVQLNAQLSQVKKPSGPNSLYDAVFLAAGNLRRSKIIKRSLFIISDSEDHRSQHNFSRLRDTVRSFDVQVYAVILNSPRNLFFWDWSRRGERRERIILGPTDLDRAALEDLARRSGGAAITPSDENSRAFGEIYRQINLEMRQQYSLSFYPKVEDGSWHKLRVRIRDSSGKKYSLSYKRGYRSPSPAKSSGK